MSKRAIYYDTETTGLKPGKDRLIELAAYDPVQERQFVSLINPQCPIPVEASNISHITDEMVKDAPSIQEVLMEFVDFCSDPDLVLVAHNNDAFDQPFLQAEFTRANLSWPNWKFFDTLKWARKYRPDLPRHSLQSLREVYGIEANQAHRALDDVMILYRVFSKMVGDLSWETILQLMDSSKQLLRMSFGKHAGKLLTEVPKDYVTWLAGSGVFEKKENEQLKKNFEKLGLL